jgi:hypothetical protein
MRTLGSDAVSSSSCPYPTARPVPTVNQAITPRDAGLTVTRRSRRLWPGVTGTGRRPRHDHGRILVHPLQKLWDHVFIIPGR